MLHKTNYVLFKNDCTTNNFVFQADDDLNNLINIINNQLIKHDERLCLNATVKNIIPNF